MKIKVLSIITTIALIISILSFYDIPVEAKTATKNITFTFKGRTATICKVKVSDKSVVLKGKIMSEKNYLKYFKKKPTTFGMGQYFYDAPIVKNNDQIGITLLEYYKGNFSPNNYVDFRCEGFEICGIKRGMSEKKAYKKLVKIFGRKNIKKQNVTESDAYVESMKNYKSSKYKYVIDGTKGDSKFLFTIYIGNGKVKSISFQAGDYSKLKLV